MKALPHVDRETADTLRARQQGQDLAAATVSVDAVSLDSAEPSDTAASVERDSHDSGPSELSSHGELYNDVACSNSSSSNGGAGFARGRHVVQLLSITLFSASIGSESGSHSRPAIHDTPKESSARVDMKASSSVRESVNGSSRSCQHEQSSSSLSGTRGSDATLAQPAAPCHGGLPSPDSSSSSPAAPCLTRSSGS